MAAIRITDSLRLAQKRSGMKLIVAMKSIDRSYAYGNA